MIGRNVIAALVAVTVAALARPYWQWVNVSAVRNLAPLASYAVPLALLLLFSALFVGWLMWRPPRRFDPLLDGAPVALFVWAGAACASAALADGPANFVWPALAPYVVAVFVFALAWAAPLELSTARWMCGLAGLIVAASVIVDAEARRLALSVQRPGGLLPSRNFAAEYMTLTWPFAAVWLAPRWRCALLPLVGLALAWTRCRNAWMGAVAAMIVLLAFTDGDRRRALARATVLTIAGTIAALFVPSQLSWHAGSAHGGAVRVQQYLVTLELAAHTLARGFGPGLWPHALARNGYAQLALDRHAHSDYLRALADGGLPCLAGLLIAGALLLQATWRTRKRHPDALAFAAALAVMMAADFPLARVESTVLVLGVFGFIVGGTRVAEATRESGQGERECVCEFTGTDCSSPGSS